MSMSTNRFETFELDHRLKNARVHYLPEGELWFAEKDAGLWAISWYRVGPITPTLQFS